MTEKEKAIIKKMICVIGRMYSDGQYLLRGELLDEAKQAGDQAIKIINDNDNPLDLEWTIDN